jgi:hypothetical protein
LDKKFNCLIPAKWQNSTIKSIKSIVELLYEITDLAKTFGGAA